MLIEALLCEGVASSQPYCPPPTYQVGMKLFIIIIIICSSSSSSSSSSENQGLSVAVSNIAYYRAQALSGEALFLPAFLCSI